jgi:hypothetical protein
MDIDLDSCPHIHPSLQMKVYHSATAVYHAPSDLSGIGGMHREHIRATPSWLRREPRHDCVFVEKDPGEDGFRGDPGENLRQSVDAKWVQPCVNLSQSTAAKMTQVKIYASQWMQNGCSLV